MSKRIAVRVAELVAEETGAAFWNMVQRAAQRAVREELAATFGMRPEQASDTRTEDHAPTPSRHASAPSKGRTRPSQSARPLAKTVAPSPAKTAPVAKAAPAAAAPATPTPTPKKGQPAVREDVHALLRAAGAQGLRVEDLRAKLGVPPKFRRRLTRMLAADQAHGFVTSTGERRATVYVLKK
jgi:hypothetical protein